MPHTPENSYKITKASNVLLVSQDPVAREFYPFQLYLTLPTRTLCWCWCYCCIKIVSISKSVHICVCVCMSNDENSRVSMRKSGEKCQCMSLCGFCVFVVWYFWLSINVYVGCFAWKFFVCVCDTRNGIFFVNVDKLIKFDWMTICFCFVNLMVMRTFHNATFTVLTSHYP